MAAPRRRPRSASQSGTKFWATVGIALLVGLTLGALLYRGIHHSVKRPLKTSTPKPAATVLMPPPLPKPRGPAPGLPAATQFDFYTILPEIRNKDRAPPRSAPRQALTQAARPIPTPAPVVPVPIAGRFILQAASFPDTADASRLRAELALRGLGSYIEKVSITGRGAFYRVRLGPLSKRQVGHDRKVLARLGVKPILLREARGN